MAERPEYSIELRARALAMIATGRSHRDVARELGIPSRTLGRWARAAKPATAQRPKDQGDPDDPDVIDSSDPFAPFEGLDMNDSLSVAKAQRNSFLILARKATEAGNMTAAASASQAAAKMAPTIKAIEKARGEESDWIRIRREDVERLVAGLRAKVEILAARGMLCAECSRELSIKWGGVEDPPDRSDKIGVRK